MNTILDKAFGEMIYKHSWQKEEFIDMWGQNYKVSIQVRALKGEEINPQQQESYIAIKDNLVKIINNNVPKIASYCISSFDLNEVTTSEITSKLAPRTLLFQRDGSWGLLFDCDYDKENGLVLYLKNGDLVVGLQDDFL